MGFTASFRRQHDEILDIVQSISANLDEEIIVSKHEDTSDLLNQLAGKLLAHLTMEDKVLYPKLLGHEKAEVKNTAKDFMDEMGGLSSVFAQYVEKWKQPTDIRDNPKDFITETNGLFSALGERVDRENNVLYPLADES